MDTQVRHVPKVPAETSAQIPPPLEPAARPRSSRGFAFLTVVVLLISATLGALRSGRITLDRFMSAPKTAALVKEMIQTAPNNFPIAPATAAKAMPASAAARVVPQAAAPRAVAQAKAPEAPAETIPQGAAVVTSIGLAEPRFAIINGVARSVGDDVPLPGATGWRVARIADGAVTLQKGRSYAVVEVTTPGVKPLDDSLKPLN